MHATRLGLLGITLLSFGACSSDGDGGGGGDAGSGAHGAQSGGAGGTDQTQGTGGVGAVTGSGGTPAACEGPDDCATGQICHLYSHSCVVPGERCADHADCDAGTYCDPASSSCLPGATGSPCASSENCAGGGQCSGGVCGCSGSVYEQEGMSGPLDIYFIFDRTASMGDDCDYEPGRSPPVDSKACFATYALADYLTTVTPEVDTRLAFQFMSLAQPGAEGECSGALYATPRVDLTPLPMPASDPLILAISDETFEGGFGTHIEGALRGLAQYTPANATPGREMIGVLMTDGDPNGCEEDIGALRDIIADHLAATGIRTFVIGMEGATDENLEQLATAGGAEPHDDWCGDAPAPCHYWNVGDGSGDAIASALQAIIRQAVPLPCEYDVAGLRPPEGESLDFGKINVTLTDPSSTTTTIGRAQSESACPSDSPAWYYDDPSAPASIHLCPVACELVTAAANGSRMSIVVGCQETVVIR